MVLLGQVLLPVVVRVSPSVAPLEGVRGGNIDILEVVVSSVGTIRSRLGEGDTSVGTRGTVRSGEGGHSGH